MKGLTSLSASLSTSFEQASTGKRINAADDPSGLAIYEALTAQANGFNVAASNAQNASNARGAAGGAPAQTSNALQQLRSLAVEATDDFLSPSDRQAIEEQANQLVDQIHTVAQTATSYASTISTPATAAVTANAPLNQGGNLISSVAATSSSQSGTIRLAAVSAPAGPGVDVRFTDTTTGQTTDLGVQAPGSTMHVEDPTKSRNFRARRTQRAARHGTPALSRRVGFIASARPLRLLS